MITSIEMVDEYIHKHFSISEEKIYHSTDQKGYDGISRNNCLYLNSHHYLNDKNSDNNELRIGYDLMIEELSKSKNLPVFIGRIRHFFDSGIVFYTASFSRQQSRMVSRKYKSEYCLVFKRDFLKKFESKNRATLFAKVEYEPSKQSQIIKEIVKVYDDHISNNQCEQESVLTKLTTHFAHIMPLLKDKKDEIDQECRMVQVELFRPNDGTIMLPQLIKKINFHLDNIDVIHLT